MTITVKFFSHLKEKAGVHSIEVNIPADMTIATLKRDMIQRYPALETHLHNILILMDKKIVLDEDVITPGSTISFMTPIGGG